MASANATPSYVFLGQTGTLFDPSQGLLSWQQQVNFVRWSTTLGFFGSTGTAEVTLVLSDLVKQGINLFELAKLGNIEVYISAPALAPTSFGSPGQLQATGIEFVPSQSFGTPIPILQAQPNYQPNGVFGGVVSIINVDVRADEVHIEAQDFSSLLHEQIISEKRIINQSVATVVKLFANDVGLKTAFTAPFIQAATGLVGHFLEVDQVSTNTNTTRWDLLQRIARDTVDSKGNQFVCFTTPSKEIYFAPPNIFKKAPREYTLGKDLIDVKIRHSPKRNKSFKVVFNSYHPKTARKFREVYVQQGVGNKTKQVPIYVFREDGLTREQCQQKAQAKAYEIAKREIVVTAIIQGDAGLLIWGGGAKFVNVPLLNNDTYNVSSITHSYEIPQEGSDTPGYATTFSAWNLPLSATREIDANDTVIVPNVVPIST